MIGSDPNRGIAFDQSLPSSEPRHARVTFGIVARQARRSITAHVRSGRGNCEFDQRKIQRDASVTYDPAGIIVVASAWLAFYVAAVIHLL
jgi:hypothetical protein